MKNLISELVITSLVDEDRPIHRKKIKEKLTFFQTLDQNLTNEDLKSIENELLELYNNPMSIEDGLKFVNSHLNNNEVVSSEMIAQAIRNILKIKEGFGLDNKLLRRKLDENLKISTDIFRSIESLDEKLPWLLSKKTQINWNFWKRYKDYLLSEQNIPYKIVNEQDRLTDSILDNLFDPTSTIKNKKLGLVVGHVQSGKTSNYIGLICKAADAGYKFIVVLAGIHNNLRSQTQIRIDEGFLGFDTQHKRANNSNNLKIGVGKSILESNCTAHSLTTSRDNGDFNNLQANSLGVNFNTNEPIIVVIKKNVTPLNNLITWLKAQSTLRDNDKNIINNKSILVIDDEADNASINTNKNELNPTRINQLIRDLLNLFNQSAYVGYTATPFANLFINIDKDDLFPRHFIINIPQPTNYIGPDKIFGIKNLDFDITNNSLLPILNTIQDENHWGKIKKSEIPNSLPESLKIAIYCFILTIAIRNLRGQKNKHNSMLIHISRYKIFQQGLYEVITEYFEELKNKIEYNDLQIYSELKDLYKNDKSNYKSYTTVTNEILISDNKDIDSSIQLHNWNDIELEIKNAVSKIKIKIINGGSGEILDYYDNKSNGLNVIAIGGDKLSRGLTLEGLSISYYLRTSKMYDTLMQMGRWFGYRPGYLDLCRIFTSSELISWFSHITLATQELREEFDYMSNIAGAKPIDFVLKVRNHPGVLQISATNKIRNAIEISLSWSARLVETYQLLKDKESVLFNLNLTQSLFDKLGQNNNLEKNNKKNYYLWKEKDSTDIINFLEQFKTPDSFIKGDPKNIAKYIKAANDKGELNKWNICLMNKQKGQQFNIKIENKNTSIGMFIRNTSDLLSDTYYIRKNHILGSQEDEYIDLDNEILLKALKRTKEDESKKGKIYNYNYPSGTIVRKEFRLNPLLIIYLLDPKGALCKDEYDALPYPIVGFAISFPKSNQDVSATYLINNDLYPEFQNSSINENIDEEED